MNGYPSREKVLFDAPAIYWRSIGAAAIAITNKDNVPPSIAEFDGSPFETWEQFWHDQNRAAYLLKVRQFPNSYQLGPGTLMVLSPPEDDGVSSVCSYCFEVAPYTQERKHVLIVFRLSQIFDEEPDISMLQAQRVMQMETGLILANYDDALNLYTQILLAPFSNV